MGILYLLPNLLGETGIQQVIPEGTAEVIKRITVFATEEIKNTRRYLKKLDKHIDIDRRIFLELNEHTDIRQVESYLTYLEEQDMGIISEAGCPGIADPGAALVSLAHRHHYKVVPLVGPSSILLALMASGFSGQQFSFNGYLPIPRPERLKALKFYEKQSVTENRTQLFIETPYRNLSLLQDMITALSPRTRLSIACDLTTEGEYIRTLTLNEWRQEKPELHKRPALFSLYAGK